MPFFGLTTLQLGASSRPCGEVLMALVTNLARELDSAGSPSTVTGELQPTRTAQPQPTATSSPSPSIGTPGATATAVATRRPPIYMEAIATDKSRDVQAREGIDLAQIARGVDMGGLTRFSTVAVARIDGQLHMAISLRFSPNDVAMAKIRGEAQKAGIHLGNLHFGTRHAELQLADIGNEPGRMFDGLIGISNPNGPCPACRTEIFVTGNWIVRPRVIYPGREDDAEQ